MRTTKTSPLKLWISGQMNNQVGIELTDDLMQCYGIEGQIDDLDNKNARLRPIFNVPEVLTDDYLATLNATITETSVDDGTGIEVFIKVLDIVQDLMNFK